MGNRPSIKSEADLRFPADITTIILAYSDKNDEKLITGLIKKGSFKNSLTNKTKKEQRKEIKMSMFHIMTDPYPYTTDIHYPTIYIEYECHIGELKNYNPIFPISVSLNYNLLTSFVWSGALNIYNIKHIRLHANKPICVSNPNIFRLFELAKPDIYIEFQEVYYREPTGMIDANHKNVIIGSGITGIFLKNINILIVKNNKKVFPNKDTYKRLIIFCNKQQWEISADITIHITIYRNY